MMKLTREEEGRMLKIKNRIYNLMTDMASRRGIKDVEGSMDEVISALWNAGLSIDEAMGAGKEEK